MLISTSKAILHTQIIPCEQLFLPKSIWHNSLLEAVNCTTLPVIKDYTSYYSSIPYNSYTCYIVTLDVALICYNNYAQICTESVPNSPICRILSMESSYHIYTT